MRKQDLSQIEVKAGDKCYFALVQRGLFDRIGEQIRSNFTGERLFVVTDENLWHLYGTRLEHMLSESGFELKKHIVQSGESSKSLRAYQQLCEDFIGCKITSSDRILSFGGGVVGDLTGFAAATLKRGIPYIQIPTSLIAQTDSCIGGKTALNLSDGKNLIGVFYHPSKVLIDPQLLDSLPKKYWQDGMGEVIKYALIKDEEMFRCLEKSDIEGIKELMPDLVCRCLAIKADIVARDERDEGQRRLLNFGHTLGHAIEAYYDYQGYTHGEAVAIGMSLLSAQTEKMGLTRQGVHQRIVEVLSRYGLPSQLRVSEPKRLIERMSLDKKSMDKAMDLVVLRQIGEAFLHRILKSELQDFFDF